MVYSFQRSVIIAATPERVWRALSEPQAVVAWDSSLVGQSDAPGDYPQPGQHVRWPYQLGPLRLTLHDRPQEVRDGELLRSLLSIGPLQIDETYTLSRVGEHTKLTAGLALNMAIPILGPLIDRIWTGAWYTAAVEGTLASLQRYCESDR